ncbi:choice-of-anchor L domain-containing protein, partial [Flavobacterium akiainvivens]
MRKLLLLLLLLLGTVSTVFAQSNITVFSSNPEMVYEDGETMSFTIIITNNGPDAASNVQTYFPIPSGITIPPGVTKFWWTGSNGTSGTNSQLSNTVPSLAVNQTITYTINVKIPNGYTQEIPPPVVTWRTQSDIEIINTDNQATYTPGSTVQYTVTVINHGPEATTTGVQVSNAIPAGVTNYEWTDLDGSTYNFAMIANTGILAVGQEVTYAISFDVPETFTGNLTNAVTYIANVTDPTPACTQCSDTDVPATGADIQIVTTDGNLTYTAGEDSVYTVTVTNNGPQAATNVNVSVPLPAGITDFTWTGSNTTSGTGALSDVIATLANGASVTYTITVGVPAGHTGALTLTASSTSTPADPDPSCTQCSDTDYDVTSADLAITKSLESGATYTAGNNAVYTITVTNEGPSAAQNVVVADLVPVGLSATGAYWVSSNGGFGTGNLNNTIDLLLADETVTYTFTIPVSSGFDQETDIVNTATVTSDTPDPVATNNTATHTATPNPQANLVTVKTNYQSSYIVETTTTYTITVSNPGPSDAYNVVVNDPKPYHIQIMTWAGNGTGGSGSLNNVIPVIPAGESVTYTVNLFIPVDYASFVGSLTNTVTVTSTTPDPVPGCTTCTDTDTPAGNFVTTSTDQYTIPELIEDVLIDVNCVGIDNVTWSTGSNFGSFNGIAYFNRNNAAFPIQEGVVLTCGNAVPSQDVPGVDGPNTTLLVNGVANGWPGDTELLAYAPGENRDATWIKFNFTPVSDSFSFNYLFASEEYDNCNFQCNYSDVFAFILTDLENPTDVQNLAVLPTTPPVNVLVTTVHPATPCGCAAANVDFFGQYNLGTDAATAPINFNGQTAVLTAVGTVVPNNQYSIKLVIANGNDNSHNSAVFIEAGSFDIGQPQLPGDITLENQALLLCHGETHELAASIGNPDMLVKWKKDGEWIMEEDGITFVQNDTITVSQPGTYTVMGYFESSPDCFLEDDIIIDYYPEILAAEPENLYACDDDPTVDDETWNLNDNTPIILAPFVEPENYQVFYYTNMADIENGEPGIWPETNFNPPGNAECYTMYAMIQDMQTLCYIVKEFQICKNPEPVAGQPEDVPVCDEDNDGVAIFDLTTQESIIFNGFDPDIYGVSYYTTAAGAADIENNTDQITEPTAFQSAGQTIYVRLENMFAPCFDVVEFDIIVTPLPVIAEVEDVEACDVYQLPELTTGNYFSQPGGIGAITNTNLTTSQTVYIYAIEGIAPNTCSAETSFDVTIYTSPVVDTPANIAVCDSYVLPTLNAGQYYTGPGGTGDVVSATTEITTTTTLYIYAESGNNDDVVCSDEHTFTITVNYAPVVGTASPIEVCDDNNDGYGIFNITPAGAEIIGNQTGLEVTYHNTIEDAEAGENDVTGLTNYVNTTVDFPDDAENPHVYVRVVTAGTTTNCATVVEVDLIVHPRPEIPSLTPYILCDDNNSPDGVEIFDLTTKNGEATSDPDAEVTWYATEGDAIAGTSPLADATAHESATGEVWVRVENGFGCSDVAVLQLVVNPLPVIAQNMDPFYACEETPGVGLFDFDEIDPVITQGAAGYSVAYYATMEDAVAGADDNYLVSPYAS